MKYLSVICAVISILSAAFTFGLLGLHLGHVGYGSGYSDAKLYYGSMQALPSGYSPDAKGFALRNGIKTLDWDHPPEWLPFHNGGEEALNQLSYCVDDLCHNDNNWRRDFPDGSSIRICKRIMAVDSGPQLAWNKVYFLCAFDGTGDCHEIGRLFSKQKKDGGK